ncbi:MAG: extracellular solute-binding protein [Treponema sp.]|jgi:iron(III) transport system substrate-binding protein|nr:extracellular solute-binding protein [Treponema sp.]
MKNEKNLIVCLVLFAALGVSVFAGGGSQSAPVPVAGGAASPAALAANLTLYTSEPEDLAAEMIADFNKTYPKVKIEIFRSGTGNVISKLNAELQTGGTPANILWFADIGFIKQLDDKGFILHYSPEEVSRIKPEYAYNNGMGHEVRLIYNVIAYNTRQVTSSPPADWNDLTGPAFRSKVGMANPNYSGGAFTALVVHVQNGDKVGWKFYEDMRKNDVKGEQANGTLQTKVSSGEYAAVLIVDFMAMNAKRAGSPVEVVWPSSGAVLIPTPVSIVNNLSPEQEQAAKAFVDHMFKSASQELFSLQGYIPVMPGAPLPAGAPAADTIKTMPFDLDYYLRESANIRSSYEEKFGK